VTLRASKSSKMRLPASVMIIVFHSPAGRLEIADEGATE
jgi:hypothetical protein